MKTNRKNFIKSGCMAGAALCCLGTISLGAKAKEHGQSEQEQPQPLLQQDYIIKLIAGLSAGLEDEEIRKLMKNCAIVHYKNLNMDKVLEEHIGNTEGFLNFLSEKWGWKIDYNIDSGIIIADENKNYCVCPMMNHNNGDIPPTVCYCSEGFAELMFSAVFKHPVKATVISSVIRGNESCKYKIEL
ncbi:MAG: hypothetical protein JXB00_00270 [Bacteroidales bacterium]|nr:hypothetical protein [Bacteroidales bacterium]